MSSEHLISVGELAAALELVRPVDVRWYLADPGRGRREYDSGHIPGAVFADLDTDLSGASGPGRHPLPHPATFVETLAGWGVDHRTSVVAYDSAGGAIAARLWWMLRAVGHRSVRLLDGGWSAWVDAGGPASTVVPDLAPTRPMPAPDTWPGTVDRAAVHSILGSRPLVDARAPERFRGDTEPIDARKGHIPGAVNLPHASNLGPDGRHVDPDRLRARFEDVGPDPIVYCGSGVTACHDLLAMAIAGRDDGVLYPGSWSDWSSQPDHPIETGG